MTVLTTSEMEQTETGNAVTGPGARLRKERELQGLEQGRVAAQLHLNEAMVEALEWDDFEALPGMVFTQGYLRNYARLLGLPENEIMDAYHRLCPQEGTECLNARHTVKLKQEVRSSHGLVQLATWLIVIGLAALMFMWWQGHFGWQDAPTGESVAEISGSPTEPTSPEEVSVNPPLEVDPAQAQFTPTEDQTLEQGSPLVYEPLLDEQRTESMEPDLNDDLSDVSAETVQTAQDAPLTDFDLASDLDAQAEQTSPVVTEPAVVETPPPSPGARGLLVFEFSGRCWAEVRDATGKAHIIGEKNAGFRYELETELGPFKVILGNVNAVNLTLDGEPYDLTPHTKGNVARFTLDTGRL